MWESGPMEIIARAVGPFQMNTYLAFDPATRKAAVIDPGDGIEQIVEDLRKHRLEVSHILLTHGHIDHVARAEELHRQLEVPMLLHPDDRRLAESVSQQALMFGLPGCQAPRIDGELLEGQEVTVGSITFRILHTPGHSPGSVTLVAGGDAFVGDVIFAGSIGRTDLPGGDYETLMRSIWEKIVPLGDDTRLHPGHGPSTTVGAEKERNPFLLQSR